MAANNLRIWTLTFLDIDSHASSTPYWFQDGRQLSIHDAKRHHALEQLDA